MQPPHPRPIFPRGLALLLFSAGVLAGCKLNAPVESSAANRADQASANERLWYQYPGQDWNSQALHLGNGYFGASFFGGVKQEKFTLGEKTFWTGGPGDSTNNTYGVKPGGKEHIQEVRRLIVQGKITEADQIARKYLLGDYQGFGALSTIGSLCLNFDNHEGQATHYRRELDLHRAIGAVTYEIQGVQYRREYFCSYPARALVMRITCDKPAALTFDAGIDLAHKKRHPAIKISPAQGLWEVDGNIDDNNRPYRVKLRVIPEGGVLEAKGERLLVKGARGATIFYTVATDYRLQPPDYRGADPDAITAQALNHLAGRSYEDIRAEHVRDYQRLYLRTQLHLEGGLSESEALPTNERWQRYAQGDFADLGLKELAFNLGKYLIISASRPGSLPSGLQGPWSAHYAAPWSGNYQVNINVPLIYMPENALGLAECNEPFLEWIRALVTPGREVARAYFGTEGWVSMATGNVWGFASSGGDLEWGLFPSGAAWECHHLWEQYEFNQDGAYLRERAYPVMKEAAQFWLANLTEYQSKLVAIPAVSAEQKSPRGFLLPPMQDIVLVGDLFDNVIRASEVLGVDAEFRARAAQARARLMPLKIGRLGQLQEWVEDVDDPNCKHRHFMHLLALQPCRQINPHTQPALAEAARVSMNLRGDGNNAMRLDPNYAKLACACTHAGYQADPYIGGNWSRSWKCWLWARLLDGDRADKIFSELIGEAGMENLCTYQQMPPKGTPFQLDGSATTPGFVAEMLMQSQNDEIELLPALPKAWANGAITGLRARGGFVVDIRWQHGKVTAYRIASSARREVKLRLNGQVRTIVSEEL